jgi:hypothetical protein
MQRTLKVPPGKHCSRNISAELTIHRYITLRCPAPSRDVLVSARIEFFAGACSLVVCILVVTSYYRQCLLHWIVHEMMENVNALGCVYPIPVCFAWRIIYEDQTTVSHCMNMMSVQVLNCGNIYTVEILLQHYCSSYMSCFLLSYGNARWFVFVHIYVCHVVELRWINFACWVNRWKCGRNLGVNLGFHELCSRHRYAARCVHSCTVSAE